MIDLTKITTPYGLLDEATQNALREHGGPYERYSLDNEWVAVDSLTRVGWPATVYRVKSEPPKPREWWMVLAQDGTPLPYDTFTEAKIVQFGSPSDQIVHVREVL